MRSTWIFYRKEMLEMSRSFKLLWIPIVFAILGIMMPITILFMPEILEMSGGVPPEMLSLYETPSSAMVMVQVLSQYSTMGVLVLVLSCMNSVSGERYGGTAELIMVKPISSFAIIIAKWLAQCTQVFIAFGFGYIASFYYTYQMIGPLSWKSGLASFGLYSLWLILGISIALLFSTVLRGAGAAFVTLAILALLSLLNSLLPTWFSWSPARLTALASEVLVGNLLSVTSIVICCLITVGIIVFSLLCAARLLQKRVLPN